MSNGSGQVTTTKKPHEVTAEDIHAALSELKGQAKCILEQQINANEKLINDPDDRPDIKKAAEVDPPKNPRHFPGFRDTLKEISGILMEAHRRQGLLERPL